MANNHDTEDPTVLYKYLSVERALGSLPEIGDGALRVTQPVALNDPLECATKRKTKYSDDDDEEEEDQKILKVLNFIAPEHPLEINDVKTARDRLGSQAWNELFRRQLSRRIGVVSFSKLNDHPLMWAHYADSGAGVVIGYHVSALRKVATRNGKLGHVTYFDKPLFNSDYLEFKDKQSLHYALMMKAKYWEYEKEWRLTLELKKTVGTGEYDQRRHSINLCPIPNEAVTEVYVTERTPEEAVHKIAARLRNQLNRYTAVEPKLLILSSEKYGYEVDQYHYRRIDV